MEASQHALLRDAKVATLEVRTLFNGMAYFPGTPVDAGRRRLPVNAMLSGFEFLSRASGPHSTLNGPRLRACLSRATLVLQRLALEKPRRPPTATAKASRTTSATPRPGRVPPRLELSVLSVVGDYRVSERRGAARPSRSRTRGSQADGWEGASSPTLITRTRSADQLAADQRHDDRPRYGRSPSPTAARIRGFRSGGCRLWRVGRPTPCSSKPRTGQVLLTA